MRRLAVAAGLAATLVGGLVLGAWADVPDATPSAPDPAHTLFLCTRPNPGPAGQPFQQVYVFDQSKATAQGKTNCASVLGVGWDTLKVVPAVP